MKTIGIIANPNSGKDIRRLFSYALTIGNNEKANMVERMILGAQDLGVEKFLVMPDAYNMGASIKNTLENNDDMKSELHVLDFPLKNSWKDTVLAAEQMEEAGADCIIVLGGDGTSRLLGRVRTSVPIISVSTGTNNVYPEFLEGTVAGMAAAVVTAFGPKTEYVHRDKMMEIYLNGDHVDVALVDAVVTSNFFVGSRAIWDLDEIKEVMVTRAHPSAIGFSAVIGVQAVSLPEDDFGYRIKLHEGTKKTLVPFSPGKMTEVSTQAPVRMELDQTYVVKTDYAGTLALDGERTVTFKAGDTLGFVLRRKGPSRVDVSKALEFAVEHDFFAR
ncbi:NAD(+)/NADH kinase [Alkalibacter rhizosphaerae]|uniref:NAD(+)/NADH kinase n=1 Tax=Alkalibacter rhizosphaerae TaxID=2815577 RepID=A0A975AI52_9FIRM|nr:NAD(+)/NADH kinase [Alkalibacter rhizosphaerae]QSX08319.1 NAD(+)/NADH kinase [Alkalibacter rhizosphaerae]